MIKVILPFPNPKLNPNRSKGTHWSSTSKIREHARLSAFWLTMQAKANQAVPSEFSLRLVFVQPTKRRTDLDNLLASCKPALDGVAQALGINDHQFHPITISREYGKPPGCVRVEVGE